MSIAGGSSISASGAVTLTGNGGPGGTGGTGGPGGPGGAGNGTGDGGAGGQGGNGGNGGRSGTGVEMVASNLVTDAGPISIVGASTTAGGGGAGGAGGIGGTADSESTAGANGAPGAGGSGGVGGSGFSMSTSLLQTGSGNITITGTGGVGGAGADATDGDGTSGGAGGVGVLLGAAPAGAAIQTSSGAIQIASFGGNGGAGGSGTGNSGDGGDGGAGFDGGGATVLTGRGLAQIDGQGGNGGSGGNCGTGLCGSGGGGGTGVLLNGLIQADGGSMQLRGFGGDGAKGGDGGVAQIIGGSGGNGGDGISHSGGASIIGTTGAITLSGTGGVGGPRRLVDGAEEAGSEGLPGAGVSLFRSAGNTTIETTSGDILITGLSGSAGRFAVGVTLSDVIIETTAGGSIDIRGRSEPPATGVSDGVVITTPSTIQTQGAPGTITISGESPGTNFGVVIGENGGGGANLVGGPTTSGNIVIRAANGGGGDSISLSGNTTIQTTGVINLRPGGVSTTGALTPDDSETIEIAQETVTLPKTGTFRLSPADLDTLADGAAAIVIGGNTHTGRISVLTPYTFKDNVTLQNAGEGSLGIAINAALSSPDNLITLSSAGPVTQTAPINASALLLHGTGSGSNGSNFTLTDTSNSVAQFAAASPVHGDVRYQNGKALTIGPLAGVGFDSTNNRPTAIEAPNTVSFHDLFVSAAGDLALRQDISTVGSEITLITGGAFTNPGNGQLLPGGSGRWTVWAPTSDGVVPADRGGLVPDSLRPNIPMDAPILGHVRLAQLFLQPATISSIRPSQR